MEKVVSWCVEIVKINKYTSIKKNSTFQEAQQHKTWLVNQTGHMRSLQPFIRDPEPPKLYMKEPSSAIHHANHDQPSIMVAIIKLIKTTCVQKSSIDHAFMLINQICTIAKSENVKFNHNL